MTLIASSFLRVRLVTSILGRSDLIRVKPLVLAPVLAVRLRRFWSGLVGKSQAGSVSRSRGTTVEENRSGAEVIMSHLYPRHPGPLILSFQGNLGCAWVADFARLVRILPM